MADNNIFGIINYGDITQTILIIIVVMALLRAIKVIIPQFANQFSSKTRLTILSFMPILRLIILIFSIIFIFRIYVDPTQDNLLALAGASALALGFAFKDYISNLLAGITILAEMPFKPGDWVEVNGIYGEVKSVGLRVLELVTPDDTIVKIPQATFWMTPIFNSTGGQQDLLCVTYFYLEPNHDPAKIRHLLMDVVKTSPYTQLRKPSTVVITEKPGYTTYKVKAYPIDSRDQFQFISDITIRGKQVLNDANVKYYTHNLLQNQMIKDVL